MLIKDILNYGGTAIASKIIPLAMIFIFPLMMSAADFGLISLFYSYAWILAIGMSLNLYSGIGRVLYEPDINPGEFIGTAVIFLAICLSIFALLWLMLGPYLTDIFGLPASIMPFFILIVFGFVTEQALTQIMIFQKRSQALFVIVLFRAMGVVVLAVAFIATMEADSYRSVIQADAIFSVLLIIAAFWLQRGRVLLTFNRQYAARLARFSLPLIAYPVALTMLAQSDRILINWFFDKEAVGLYSLAYNFSAIPLIASAAVLNALHPSLFSALNTKDFERVNANGAVTLFLSGIAIIGVAMLGEPVAQFFFPARFAPGFDIIPVVALSCIPLVLFQIHVRHIVFLNRTGLLSITVVVSLVFNLLLNISLLPLFGYKIAAFNTLAAYGLLMLIIYFFVARLHEGRIPVRVFQRGLVLFGMGAVAVAAVYWLDLSVFVDLALRLLATSLLVGYLVYTSYADIRHQLPALLSNQ